MTSHASDPLPLSQTITPSRTPSPLERDVLYGRPLTRVIHVSIVSSTTDIIYNLIIQDYKNYIGQLYVS